MPSIKNFYEEIKEKANVVGTAIGFKNGIVDGEPCYLALVEKKEPEAQLSRHDILPKWYYGATVDVLEVGKLWAHRTDRVRPVPGGVSVGHYSITAGTVGAIVRDSQKKGHWFILSNNHVLAASNSATIGDPILQPGAYDGGTVEKDQIGELSEFVPIVFNGDQPPIPPDCGLAERYARWGNALAAAWGSTHRVMAYVPREEHVNEVDAAIAAVKHNEVTNRILDIGVVSESMKAVLGMPVRKSGRTTGLTTGSVIGTDATVTVQYGGGLAATFENQIITTGMSAGGDSGSLLVHGEELKALGLLFGGSEQITIHSPIDRVLELLGVEWIA